MLTDPEDQNKLTPTVFESWYETMNMEELIFDPLYRNLLNTNITLNINSNVTNRHAIHEGRLNGLVIPQIDSFVVELLGIEHDLVADKNYAYIKICLRTANTKDSNKDILQTEIRLGVGSTYTLSEFVDGSIFTLYELPPLMLFQVKEINPDKCKVRIGPVDSIEI